MAVSRLNTYRLLLAVSTVVFVALALRPGLPEPILAFPHSDKAQHFGAFLLFAYLTHAAYPRLSIWLKMGVLAAIGLAVELAQIGIPHRHFSGGDLLANCAAIGLFYIFMGSARVSGARLGGPPRRHSRFRPEGPIRK